MFIHSTQVDNWVSSAFWLMGIMLLWTWVYKYLLKAPISLFLDIYLEVKLLDHLVILFLIFWGMAIVWCIFLPKFHELIWSQNSFPTLYLWVSRRTQASHKTLWEILISVRISACSKGQTSLRMLASSSTPELAAQGQDEQYHPRNCRRRGSTQGTQQTVTSVLPLEADTINLALVKRLLCSWCRLVSTG